GRLAAAGLRADAGTAVGLWRRHRELLEDVQLTETPEASAFLRSLAERRRDLFLLLTGRPFTPVGPGPPREAGPPRPSPPAARPRAADELVAALATDEARLAHPVAEAVAAVGRAQTDPVLSGAIEAARRRLERALAEPPDLVAARRQVAAEVHAVATPPAPLG